MDMLFGEDTQYVLDSTRKVEIVRARDNLFEMARYQMEASVDYAVFREIFDDDIPSKVC